MKLRLLLGSAAAWLVALDAHAGDTMLHVTTNANGATILVQETPAGQVEICKTPCDVKVDPAGEYRVIGAPHSGVRKSQAFGLPNGPSVDLAIETRSQIRYVEGFILIPAGLATVAAGIAVTAYGYDLNNQVAQSGDVYIGIGVVAGIIGGIFTVLWGIGESLRNAHTRIAAAPSQQAPPPSPSPAQPASPVAVLGSPADAPRASMWWAAPRVVAFPLVSIRF